MQPIATRISCIMRIILHLETMATPKSSTLSKGLRLLRALVVDGGRSNLTSLAQREGMPLATAHRLMATLEAEGFAERQAKGRFSIGESLRLLASSGDASHQRAIALLRQPMERIAEQHDVILHFGVFEQGMVTYLVKAGRADNNLFTAEGMQLEAYCSAIGKVLLASLPCDQLDDYLSDGPFVALTSNTVTDPVDIRLELENVKKAGVAFDRYEIHETLYCVAVPVCDPVGVIVGGLSASFIDQVPQPDRVTSLLRAMRRVSPKGPIGKGRMLAMPKTLPAGPGNSAKY
jgi:IclR family transcriptional regulator, acetate operon repressor